MPFCSEEMMPQLPQLMILSPAKQRINPYTKKERPPQQHTYQGAVNVVAISKFAKEHLPNYSINLDEMTDFEEFLVRRPDVPHKVILFTKKEVTTALYKGLSAEYKDRLEFAEVLYVNEDITDELGITDFPTLNVYRRLEDDSLEVSTFDDELKFNTIGDWLDGFALSEKAEPYVNKEKDAKESKKSVRWQDFPGYIELNSTHNENIIFQEERTVMLHVHQGVVHEAWQQTKDTFSGPLLLLDLDCSLESNSQLCKGRFKVKSYPTIRYYGYGPDKQKSSLKFSSSATFEDIYDEVDEDLQDTSTKINQEFTTQYVQRILETKTLGLVLYGEGPTPWWFRALQQNSDLKERTISFAYFKDISPELVQAMGFPHIPVLFIFSNKNPGKDIEQIDLKEDLNTMLVPAELNYESVLNWLINSLRLQQDAVDEAVSTTKITHIETFKQLNRKCLKRQNTCMIGLFNEHLDSAQENVELLRGQGYYVKGQNIDLYWIDAECHFELLMQLQISPQDLPTVIAFNTKTNRQGLFDCKQLQKRYSKMIGMFREGDIRQFMARVVKQKIQTVSAGSALNFEDKDCQQYHLDIEQKLQQPESNEEEDEILREILEEERLERERREKRKNRKGKKKRKKRRKKKKDL